MSSSTDSPLESIGKGAVSAFIFTLGLAMRGWALTKLWGWFIVPLGVPAITFWHALGVAVFLTYVMTDMSRLMKEVREDDREWKEKTIERFLVAIVMGPLAVLLGWVYWSFMS